MNPISRREFNGSLPPHQSIGLPSSEASATEGGIPSIPASQFRAEGLTLEPPADQAQQTHNSASKRGHDRLTPSHEARQPIKRVCRETPPKWLDVFRQSPLGQVPRGLIASWNLTPFAPHLDSMATPENLRHTKQGTPPDGSAQQSFSLTPLSPTNPDWERMADLKRLGCESDKSQQVSAKSELDPPRIFFDAQEEHSLHFFWAENLHQAADDATPNWPHYTSNEISALFGDLQSESADFHAHPMRLESQQQQHNNPSLDAQFYTSINLKQIPQTSIAYRDSDLLKELKPLGKGSFNTVFWLILKDHAGEPFQGVFKPLAPTDSGWALRVTGVDPENPQIAMRNLATQAYASKLGFDVIAQTQVALFTVPPYKNNPSGPHLGLLMRKALGKEAYFLKPASFKRPDVLRELTKLQLLDHLTAQCDRHRGNYFVHIDSQTNKVHVTGIDNDQCFGPNVKNSLSLVSSSCTPDLAAISNMEAFKHVVSLPPVVDVKMFKAIKNITQKDLQNMLSNLLNAEEIDASIQRLEIVQAHLSQLKVDGFLIDDTDWASEKAQQSLMFDNSYAHRDALINLKKCRSDQW